jgi:hypothetical protein
MAPCPVTQGITVPSHSARTKPLPLLRYFGRSIPLVPFQLFMATLPFRAVVVIAIRDTAQVRPIKLERH